jgi:hypothetical protein
MNKIKNTQIVSFSDATSPYFKEALFILKDKVVATEDELLNEAIKIVTNYSNTLTKKKPRVLKIAFRIVVFLLSLAGVISFFK